MYSSPLQECSHSSISRIVDRILVRSGRYGDVVFECRDYEHKQPEGLRSRPGRQLH